MDIVTLGAALHGAKSYTDATIAPLLGGVHYRGSVNYASNLPASPAEGDAYTVKYKGTTGTDPDGAEYVWGLDTDDNTYKWIVFAGDSYTKAEVDALLSGKQATIDSTHKLSSDLVDDTNATHKFATSDQLDQIGANTTSITTQKKLNDYLALFGAPNCCFNSEITQETTVSGVKFTPWAVPPVTSRGMVDVKGTATDDIDILYDSIELPSTLSGLVMTVSLFVVYPYPITIITGYDPDSGDVLATLDGSQGITTVDFTLPNPLPRQISVVLHIANGTVADTTVALGIYPKELASLDGVSYGSTGAFSFRTNGEINEKIDELKTVIGDINTVLEGVL